MFKFLTNWIGIITIISVFFALISTGRIIILPEDVLEAVQTQLETERVEKVNISEEDSSMNTLVEESGEDEDTFKEETGEKQGSADGEEIKDENNSSGQNEDQNIDFSNSDDFRIEVDLSRQRVFIYYKDNQIKEMVCSGGTEEKPTPIGEFETYEKIEYSWVSKYNIGAYYWVRFYNEYLFHSVPFDENGEIIIEEYEKLGTPASHGCIRLELEEAKWLYEMLPLGVKVLIYE